VVERSHDFMEIRKNFIANLLELLVDIHTRSDEPMKVLEVGNLIFDPKFCLYKVFVSYTFLKLFLFFRFWRRI